MARAFHQSHSAGGSGGVGEGQADELELLKIAYMRALARTSAGPLRGHHSTATGFLTLPMRVRPGYGLAAIQLLRRF
jgi:hypothetical protein